MAATTRDGTHLTTHAVRVRGSADAAYRLLADVSLWPQHFQPTVFAERVEGDDTDERIRIWAFANGEVRNWTSRRTLDRAGRRIVFRQEVSQPPVESMGGSWVLRAEDDGCTVVELGHDFRAVGDDPDSVAWIARAVEQNSRRELDAVKSVVERAALDDLTLSFTDTVPVRGPVEELYDFVYRCQDWPERLPHVSRLEVRESEPGVQTMSMDTRSPDGEVHTTESVRICFPATRIVYKQTVVPPIMSAHTGCWRFTAEPDGTATIASQHTVVLDPDAVPRLLGPGGTLAEARRRVREALGNNSMATMRLAKAYVEAG